MKNLLAIIFLSLCPVIVAAQGDAGVDDGGSDSSITVEMARSRAYTEGNKLVYEDYSDLPPYSFIDEYGRKTGYNVELVRELLDGLGIPYEIELKHIDEAYTDLKNGSADLILSIKARKREGNGIYGKVPIALFTTSLLTPKSKPLVGVRRVRELGDNRVLVHTGSLSHDVMRERGMEDNALPVVDMTSAIMRIARSDSGMVVWNTMSMKYIINTYGLSNLQLTPINDLHTDLRFIAHDTLLLAQLDSAFMARQSDPVLLNLRRKWFYPETEVHSRPYLIKISVGILMLTVMAVLVYFWYKHREREYARFCEQQNLQLSLYLKTGGISMWTYKVMRKQFCLLSKSGEEEEVQDPTVFGSSYHPDDFAATLVAIEQIAAGERESQKLTVRKIDGEGQYKYYDLQLSVLEHDSHRHVRVILGMQSDTTLQRQKHLEFKEATLKFQTVFNVSNAWLLCFDSKGWLTDINPTACNEFGIADPHKLIADGFKMEGLPFDLSNTGADEGREVWMSAQTDLDKYRAEGHLTHHVTIRGRVYHELIIMPVVNSRGNLLATYVAGLNITDNVEMAQESIARKNEIEYIYRRSRLGMDNLSHSLSFAQVRMGIYTPATRSLSFGDSGTMSDMSPLRVVALVDNGDRMQLLHLFNHLDKRVMRHFQFTCHTRLHMRGDIGRRAFDVNVMPVAAQDGLADHYIVLTRDISDVELWQKQLVEETKKAQEAERIKNAFLRNMSAEIRRPLSNMLKSAEMLSKLPPAASDDNGAMVLSDNIHQTCRNLLALVGDVLTLSKIEAGMEEINIETVDMAVLFPAICQMSVGSNSNPRIKVKIEGAYDTLNVDTDTGFLTRIIEGLLRCSLRTTSTGFIKASYEYFNGQLVIRVEDTGDGMTPEQIAAVGDHRFSGHDGQYDLAIKMAIVQELARRLGGRLDIESAPGHGTTVWVALPCVVHDFTLHTAGNNASA